MTDESQALAQELMHVSDAVPKIIRGIRKMIGGDGMPSLEELIDVEAFSRHLLSSGAQIYAEVYTESEMRDAIAFFRSPAGQAIQAKSPIVEKRVSEATEAYVKTNIRVIQ